MATDSGLAIQQALYTKLTGDATLMALIEGVFDSVPQGTDFPYLTIGEAGGLPFDAHDFNGADVDLMIHTWARGAGRKDCKEIMGEIYRILHDATLVVVGFKPIVCRFASVEPVMLDPDGQTYHGVQRFKLILTEV